MEKAEFSSSEEDRFADTGIRECVIEEIRTLADKHGMDKVILFGSRARGDFTRASDIDLAVSGADAAFFHLDLEEQTTTLLKFDVLNLDLPLQDEIREEIYCNGRTIYEKVR